MEVSCQVCGKPITVMDVPETIAEPFRGLLMRLAKLVTHGEIDDRDSCARAKWLHYARKREDELLAVRMATLAGVCPPEFQDTDLEHLKMKTPAAVEVMAWQWGKKGLLLVGPTGRCKSRCAYMVLRREHLAGRACCQYSAGEWAMECLKLRNNYAAGGRWIDMVKSCDILMIDDFGKARLTYADHEATQATELMFDVFEWRFKNHLPVIVTTNLHAADFRKLWGEHGASFVRRLTEFCVKIEFV